MRVLQPMFRRSLLLCALYTYSLWKNRLQRITTATDCSVGKSARRSKRHPVLLNTPDHCHPRHRSSCSEATGSPPFYNRDQFLLLQAHHQSSTKHSYLLMHTQSFCAVSLFSQALRATVPVRAAKGGSAQKCRGWALLSRIDHGPRTPFEEHQSLPTRTYIGGTNHQCWV